MSSSTDLSDAPPTPAPTPDDWARTLVLRQLQILGELAEQGLEVGRAIERVAKAAEPGDGDETDLNALAMAHARAARAVRMTLMLQSKLVEALQGADKADADRRTAARSSVARLIRDAIDAERANDAERGERLRAEAAERLEQEDFSDLNARPVGEVAAAIGRDLGLALDWLSLAQAGSAPQARAPEGSIEVGTQSGCRVLWIDPDAPPGLTRYYDPEERGLELRRLREGEGDSS